MINRRSRIALASAGAIGTWALSYVYLTDYIKRSSSLIQQTLFNLESSPQAVSLLGPHPFRIASPVEGELNQVKGVANLSFKCTGPEGIS